MAGATGYIGRAVVQESVRQGYQTIALVRNIEQVQSQQQQQQQQQKQQQSNFFEGATLVECDVTNAEQVNEVRFFFLFLSHSTYFLQRIYVLTKTNTCSLSLFSF